MRLRLGHIMIGAAAILVAAAAASWGFIGAIKHEPDFYLTAIALDPNEARQANDELLEYAAELAGDSSEPGPWDAVFTARQINGWLAVDLQENHGDLLPPDFIAPRIAIEGSDVLIASRYKLGPVESVCTLRAETVLMKPNTFGIRLHELHAGRIRLPMNQIMAGLSTAARAANMDLRWAKIDGDPVAILTLTPRDQHGNAVIVESFDVRDGQIYVAGQTKPPLDSADPASSDTPDYRRADRSKVTIQF